MKRLKTIVTGVVIAAALTLTSLVSPSISSADTTEADCHFNLKSGRRSDVTQIGTSVFFRAGENRMGTYELECGGVPLILPEVELSFTITSPPVHDALHRWEFGRGQSLILSYDEGLGGLNVVYGDIKTIIPAGKHMYSVQAFAEGQALTIDGVLIGVTSKVQTAEAKPINLSASGGYDSGSGGDLSAVLEWPDSFWGVVEDPIEEPVVEEPMAKTQKLEVLCTGSMDPAITCLDDLLFQVTLIKPEDVNVGTVILYTPSEECLTFSPGQRAVHRVIETRISDGGGKEFLTQGDNPYSNSMNDGCWIPLASVNGFLIEIIKGQDAEGLKQVALIARWETKNLSLRRELVDLLLIVKQEEEAVFVYGPDYSTEYLESLQVQFEERRAAYQANHEYILYLRDVLQDMVWGNV